MGLNRKRGCKVADNGLTLQVHSQANLAIGIIRFKDYQTSLADWNGLNDWSYTANGETVTIHNISVNPSLSDSLFEHT